MKIRNCELIIQFEPARNWMHAHYVLRKNGVEIGILKSSATPRCLNPCSFPFERGNGNLHSQYIKSADKKEFRKQGWVMESVPPLPELGLPKQWGGAIPCDPYYEGLKRLGIKWNGKGWFACVPTSVKCVPFLICPTCGHSRANKTDSLHDVVFQYSRCEQCKRLKFRSKFGVLQTAFGSLCDSRAKDPRAFLYERKTKISKETIKKKVIGHLKRVLMVRPLSNSERDFFKLIIGARQLTQLA